MGNELYHFGIKGMRWGVRRFQKKDGGLTSAGKKRYDNDSPETGTKVKTQTNSDKKSSTSTSAKKSVKSMTDEELRERINRLDLEKRYKDLVKTTTPQKSTRGKDFVMDVLEKSGKNVATQLTTYVMGVAVNKAFAKAFNDASIINPKKGQKDK